MKQKKVGFLFALLALIVVSYFNYLIFKYRILGSKRIDIYVLIVSMLFCLFVLLLNLKKSTRKVSIVLSVLLMFISTFGIFTINKIKTTFDQLNTAKEVELFKVIALKDSPLEKVGDIQTIHYSSQEKLESIHRVVQEMEKKYNKTFSTKTFASNGEMFNALEAKEIDSMLISQKYISVLEASDPQFLTKIKVLDEFRYEKQVKHLDSGDYSNAKKQFHIYISGIDTFGDINVVSRSDVNIILSADLETGKILLTSTPRDAYLPIPDGGNNQKDKLTHAGIYGVETSVKTLENLYDIRIPYYLRVNFTSFIEIIDVLGGVEVENDQTFTSLHGNYYFEKGRVKLGSKEALGFVRERYSLINGDEDRAKNQEKVLEAIIKKLASPDMITNAGEILNKISKSIQTNIELTTLFNWVNYQANKGKDVRVESIALKGEGRQGLISYAMPHHNLYMTVVDEAHLEVIKQRLKSMVGE